MRRSVVTVMSGLSVAVMGLGLRASSQPVHRALAAAPAGIVTVTRTTARSAPRVATRVVASPAPSTASATAGAVTKHPTVRHPVTPQRASAPRVVASKAPRPSPRPSSVTVNGQPADTPYGPVQVQITITNGKIVRADAIDYPQGSGRDQEINSQAIPQLNDETLRAQSANIDTVSGATYTSDAYRQSLQSALDAAHRR